MAVRRCNKRRRANIRRRSEAQHCSSLCSQSEGDEYCGGLIRLKIQQSHALKRCTYSQTCSWPSLCEQSELQCFASVLRLGRIGNSVDGLITFSLSPNIPSLCGLKSRGLPCFACREGLWRIRMQYITCVRGTYVRLPRAGVRGSISRSSQRIRSHGW